MEENPIDKLPIVKSFRKVIESRNMEEMTKELYDFLSLNCGFIAHYNINGFRAAYAAPRDFSDVFIRHFDRNHRYFCSNYPCHGEPYRDTGFTKAAIKNEFFHIVELHKKAISKWADGIERDRRYTAFRMLKREFEEDEISLCMECELCGKRITVSIKEDNQDNRVLEKACCIYCGQPIYMKGEANG